MQAAVLSVLLLLPCQALSYCWQAGWNPGFTGPPVVEQVNIDRVRVSWNDIVKHRECADQFLVKYWPKSAPSQYATSELVPTDVNAVDIVVTPKISYMFQAVAREDKGLIGGIDWNKSPIVEFKTSVYNPEVKGQIPPSSSSSSTGSLSASEEKPPSPSADSIDPDDPYADASDSKVVVAGLSIELLVGIVVGSAIVLLVICGVLYRMCVAGKRQEEDDEEDDEDEDDFEDEDAHKATKDVEKGVFDRHEVEKLSRSISVQ